MLKHPTLDKLEELRLDGMARALREQMEMPETYADMTFDGAENDVVVWPETAIPAFYHQVEESYIPFLEEKLAGTGMSLLTGVPVLDREVDNVIIAGQPAFGRFGFEDNGHPVMQR